MIEDKNLSCFPTNVSVDYVKFYGDFLKII